MKEIKGEIKVEKKGEKERNVIFTPVFGTYRPEKLADKIIEDSLAVKLGLQIHKYIWPDNKDGIKINIK